MGYLMKKGGAGRRLAQPHRPCCAIREWRRRRRGEDGADRRSQFADRHGADGRLSLHRRHRCAAARALHPRSDQDHRQARKGHRAERRRQSLGAHLARRSGGEVPLCRGRFGHQHRRKGHGGGEVPRQRSWRSIRKAKTFRVFGAGLRNPQGMAFEPKSGALWVAVNERDMLGSDIVPDYITRVGLGDNFGWPWYLLGRAIPTPA